MDSFDVIVVGGGPAGCVLAARLSEDPARTVCLLEAGPDHGPRADGHWPAELLHAGAIPDSHDWHDEHGSLPWARVIGGCSSHNACAVTQAPPADYEWSEGWSHAALAPCLDRARAAIGARARDEVGAWHAAVLDACVDAGLERLEHIDAERPGVAIAATNVDGGARNNAAFAYLDPARGRSNLTVMGDTVVDRVVIERGRAAGVVAGDTYLGADKVVLAAGAYGSPAVLLRSGIGPPDELEAHGILVRHALPEVGRGLADHCRAGVGFALSAEAAAAIQADAGDRAIVAQCMAKWASSHAERDWDVHLLAIVPPNQASGRITAGLVAPRSRGRVRLRSPDPSALPLVEPAYLTEPADLAALGEAIDFARGLSPHGITHELDPGPEVAAGRHVRDTVASYYHPTGTCALGAVVGDDTAVRGLEGLHVADASIVPGTIRAGTHLTALAVAERAAELLAGR